TIAGEFQKIVQAGATEYMLVNVSELRDYIMGARMITDITWNAPAVYGSPDPAGRYLSWWTREYVAPAAAQARAAYDAYHTLLDALSPFEQLETDFARAEYPPFDRWYGETWIRAGLQRNNPHRAYVELRGFIGSDGRSRLEPLPAFGRPPVAAGSQPRAP